jgi:uncharacterized membrane protein YGL010W
MPSGVIMENAIRNALTCARTVPWPYKLVTGLGCFNIGWISQFTDHLIEKRR